MLDPVLVLFAKLPRPGLVKTRLVPPLTHRQASELALWLIHKSLQNATRHWPGPVELSLSPNLDKTPHLDPNLDTQTPPFLPYLDTQANNPNFGCPDSATGAGSANGEAVENQDAHFLEKRGKSGHPPISSLVTHIEDLAESFGAGLSNQCEGDLGEKMAAAIRGHLAGGSPVAIMGCDVPQCPQSVFHDGYNLLKTGQNVIGPTEDGGYYLIGMNQHDDSMFDDVQWGTNHALAQTLAACRKTGIEFKHPLPVLRDLDSYGDLRALSVYDSQLQQFLIE